MKVYIKLCGEAFIKQFSILYIIRVSYKYCLHPSESFTTCLAVQIYYKCKNIGLIFNTYKKKSFDSLTYPFLVYMTTLVPRNENIVILAIRKRNGMSVDP